MSDDDYEIGYKKPPKSGQFKKGKSGNPKGRPKQDRKERTFWEVFRSALNRPVAVKIEGRDYSATIQEALIMTLTSSALNGNHQALKIAVQLMDKMSPPAGMPAAPKMVFNAPADGIPEQPPIFGEDNEGAKKEDPKEGE